MRCAPPANRPTPAERDNCLPYLVRELTLLPTARVIVCLGAFAWDARCGCSRRGAPCRGRGRSSATAREATVGGFALLGCYHPSQQNTFTGKLTEAMMDDVFGRARELAGR